MHLMLAPSLLLCLLTSAVFTSLAPSPAKACSGAYVCRKLGGVEPGDGATGVPRNIELRITYMNAIWPDSRASATLETDDGQVVPTTWYQAQRPTRAGMQLWIGRPASPLAPSTHYRLRHSYRACSETDGGSPLPESSCGGLCVTTVGDVVSEFTTGATSDERELAPPVVGAPALTYVDTQVSGAACGPYSRCVYTVRVSALASGQRLRVMSGSTFVGDFGGELSVGVHRSGSNGYDRNVDLNQTGAGDYRVSVVDATGNRSAERTLSVPACTEAPDSGTAQPDAAIPDGSVGQSGSDVRRSDGGFVPADSGALQADEAAAFEDGGLTATNNEGGLAATDNEGGCSLHGTHTAWTSPLWFALAMLLARRRHRCSTI